MHSTRLVGVLVVCVVAGCPALKDVPCNSDTDCDLASGGKCVAALGGQTWCAFPDSACDSGLRYSNDNVGDGVGGTCTGTGNGSGSGSGNPPGMSKLTVKVVGSGTGMVAGDLTCATGTCDQLFPTGTQINLTATAATKSFAGWTTACSGTSGCSITLDKDASVGAVFGDPGEALWAKSFGSTGVDGGAGAAATSDGNVIVTGTFAGAVSFGTVALATANDQVPNMFVAKIDGLTGDVIWARKYGMNTGAKVILDAADNIYVAGEFAGVVDFGVGAPLNSAGGIDVGVVKLGPTGDPVWAVGMGGASDDSVTGFAVRDDHVAVVGSDIGITIGTQTYPSNTSYDVFAADLKTDGTIRWSRSFGGAGQDYGGGCALDSHDNMFLTGTFQQTVNFGTAALTAAGNADMFLVRLDAATGNTSLQERVGGTSATVIGGGLGVDAVDNVLIAGQYAGTVNFGSRYLVSGNSKSEVFAAKFSSTGTNNWAQAGATSCFNAPGASIVTRAGDIVYDGTFSGGITFDTTMYTSTNGCVVQPGYQKNDLFIVALRGATGTLLDSMVIGGTANKVIGGLDQAADLRRYATGAFLGMANFQTGQLTSAGSSDAFVLGLAPR